MIASDVQLSLSFSDDTIKTGFCFYRTKRIHPKLDRQGSKIQCLFRALTQLDRSFLL